MRKYDLSISAGGFCDWNKTCTTVGIYAYVERHPLHQDMQLDTGGRRRFMFHALKKYSACDIKSQRRIMKMKQVIGIMMLLVFTNVAYAEMDPG